MTTARENYDLRRPLGEGEVFYFSFGAIVFRDVAPADREAWPQPPVALIVLEIVLSFVRPH